MGGDAAARARLDQFFTQLNAGPNAPNEWAGNEPNLDTPWVYDSAGAPWQTQSTVRSIMTPALRDRPRAANRATTTSARCRSWYVWAAMGLYPQTPGVPMLVVGTPLFDRVTVHAGNGRLIQVNAPGAGDANPYMQSLRVNGRSTQHTYLMLPDRPGLTRLDFTVGGQPDKAWGTGAHDAPPSFGAGPVHFPPSTRAQVSHRTRRRSGSRRAREHIGRRDRGQHPGHAAGDRHAGPRRHRRRHHVHTEHGDGNRAPARIERDTSR